MTRSETALIAAAVLTGWAVIRITRTALVHTIALALTLAGWQPCGNHAGNALLPPQAAAPDLKLLPVVELRCMARQAGLKSLARKGRRAELLAALVACDRLETCL
jgi:hypothetical protein